MWLNRNITKDAVDEPVLSGLLKDFFSLEGAGLRAWIKKRFVSRFFGEKPHPFVLAMQRPARAVLLGYVLEHRHFLEQWVRSLSLIVASTDRREVVNEELENIITEFHGRGEGSPSHYELLLRMGESLGLKRSEILSTPPLPATAAAIYVWQEIGRRRHWVETMAAMHSLELIANRNIRSDGATLTYFDPSILTSNDITEETKRFLWEGYEADVEHSEVPLEMVERFANDFGISESVQSTFLKSMDAFDAYLMARLHRGMEFDERLAVYASGGASR
jgi:pyrroloquinoline-quinone synthase